MVSAYLTKKVIYMPKIDISPSQARVDIADSIAKDLHQKDAIKSAEVERMSVEEASLITIPGPH